MPPANRLSDETERVEGHNILHEGKYIYHGSYTKFANFQLTERTPHSLTLSGLMKENDECSNSFKICFSSSSFSLSLSSLLLSSPHFSHLHSQQSQYRNKSGGIEEHSLVKPNLVCEATQGTCKAKRLRVKLISRYT